MEKIFGLGALQTLGMCSLYLSFLARWSRLSLSYLSQASISPAEANRYGSIVIPSCSPIFYLTAFLMQKRGILSGSLNGIATLRPYRLRF